MNGTVNIGSEATVKLMPGWVGLIVTSTVVCATRLESVCDWAMIWIGYVPPWSPGAGVAVTLPLLSMETVQPGGALAVRLYVSAKLVWRFAWNVTGVFWSVVRVVGLGVT